MKDPLPEIERALAPHGFRRIREGGPRCVCRAILKRQTLNMNRAVAVVGLDELPGDPAALLKKVKREVAFRCGFLPFIYGIGTQLVVVVNRPLSGAIDPFSYVDKVDNQWSIIQSVYVVNSESGLVASGRTWGQTLSGKFQNAIEAAIRRTFAAAPKE